MRSSKYLSSRVLPALLSHRMNYRPSAKWARGEHNCMGHYGSDSDHETGEGEGGEMIQMKQEMKCPIDLRFVSVILGE